MPDEPTAYDGWGILPDQYLRRFADDDGDTPEPRDQRNRDLPPFRPWWGESATDSAPEAQAEGAHEPAKETEPGSGGRTRRNHVARRMRAVADTARTVAASPFADRVAPATGVMRTTPPGALSVKWPCATA